MIDDEIVSSTFEKRVGDRLRAIRLQKGFSLHDVEAKSEKEFKASVLGAYERGERSVSVPRLQRLAMFYGVPIDQLLPRLDHAVITLDAPRDSREKKLRIDLAALQGNDSAEATALDRFAAMIQMQRGDFNGRVLTIRADDLRTIAAVLDLAVDTLTDRLASLGVMTSSAQQQ
ncbi:MAG: helix-turn-helix domain-containing protein [Actinomycetota bacterium]